VLPAMHSMPPARLFTAVVSGALPLILMAGPSRPPAPATGAASTGGPPVRPIASNYAPVQQYFSLPGVQGWPQRALIPPAPVPPQPYHPPLLPQPFRPTGSVCSGAVHSAGRWSTPVPVSGAIFSVSTVGHSARSSTAHEPAR
jgi:hypothetical protein